MFVRVAVSLLIVMATACGATTAQLKTRAAYDMDCPESSLTITKIDARTRGVNGCGQQLTYIESCTTRSRETGTCTWVLNTDSRPTAQLSDSQPAAQLSDSQPAAQPPSSSSREPSQVPKQQQVEFPSDALGFRFGMSPTEAESACTEANHSWKRKDEGYACSGIPVNVGLEILSRLRFCDGALCRLGVGARIDEEVDERKMLKIFKALHREYGEPRSSDTRMPQSCRNALVECIRNERAQLGARWQWSGGQAISAHTAVSGSEVWLVIKYRTGETPGDSDVDVDADVDTSVF